MQYITSIHDVDAVKVNILMDASLQAYNAFDSDHPTQCQKDKIKCPKGFEYVCCWTGVDSVFNDDKTEEIYGVIFRSQAAPYNYIFAFRGTASLLDAIDDLGVEHSHFKPFESSVSVNKHVKVESGFWDIYTEQMSGVSSMQQQLFQHIDQFQASGKPINELWITGHSLGSSLCTLFSLDVKLSRPGIHATNINFASPRTGNPHFVDLFVNQLGDKNTLRVQNTYDRVPCVPLEIMDYAHTPWALLVAFHEKHESLNLLENHSALNYQAVLECATIRGQGFCDNPDLKVNHGTSAKPDIITVSSHKPSTKGVCSLF